MSTYLLVFRAPKGVTPNSTPESAAAWSAWQQSLGAQLKDRGNPVFASAAVGGEAEGTTLRGYSLVRAADLDSAVAMAKGCPGIGAGMTVEVGEVTDTEDVFDAYLTQHAVA
jgi:hypothetical protein